MVLAFRSDTTQYGMMSPRSYHRRGHVGVCGRVGIEEHSYDLDVAVLCRKNKRCRPGLRQPKWVQYDDTYITERSNEINYHWE